MEIKNRELFFRYALPCAQTFVKRCKITQRFLDDIISKFSMGKELPKGFENTFVVAVSMLKIIAKKMGKEDIDEEVIRQYYLVDHDKVVDKRYEEMRDFDPVMCRVRIGKVIKVDGKIAKVKTEIGEHEYRTDFVKDLKEGDTVTVHYDFISEKISEDLLKNILNKKPIL